MNFFVAVGKGDKKKSYLAAQGNIVFLKIASGDGHSLREWWKEGGGRRTFDPLFQSDNGIFVKQEAHKP